MDNSNGHFQPNPDCTELPCPAGTTNQGTWYNHIAATANSSLGMVNDGDIALDSICPSGWMLPATDTTENKSLYSLVISTYGGRIVSSGGTHADVIALYPPISLIRGGYYSPSTTLITNPGVDGYYWGPQNQSNIHAYLSLFASNKVLKPDIDINRGAGSSIRCVSRS